MSSVTGRAGTVEQEASAYGYAWSPVDLSETGHADSWGLNGGQYGDQQTYYLICSAFGFADHVPADATIVGVALTIKRMVYPGNTVACCSDRSVKLWWDDAARSSEQGAPLSEHWGGTEADKTYGGPTSLWGLSSLATSVVRGSDFGVRFNVGAIDGYSTGIRIGDLRLTVYFSGAAARRPFHRGIIA